MISIQVICSQQTQCTEEVQSSSATPCGELLQKTKAHTASEKILSLKKNAMVRETTLKLEKLIIMIL